MKAASSSDIKKGLQEKTAKELIEICLRLARFKKENKELLSFILFESDDLQGYTETVKKEIASCFEEMNTANLYYVKKSLRKILRMANKFVRYAGDKTVEVEVLLYFIQSVNNLKITWNTSTALRNLYQGVVKKIEIGIQGMHEDLQYDYSKRLQRLTG